MIESSTVAEAISNLDESKLQIVLVVSSAGLLVGTITDGDIRRGLLRGLTMASSVLEITHRDPFVVPPELERGTVFQIMQTNGIRHVPVINRDRVVIGLHTLKMMFAQTVRSNTMVVMAGGQGTRLRPHTEHCPKPLLLVGGKPILEHIILRAKAEGFQHFVIAIHYLGHMIEDYFGDGGRWQIKIDYLREETPMGTAGALALLRPHPDLPFLVTNGDVLTDIRYSELMDFHCRLGATATMAVRLHEWQHPFGVVQINGVDIVGFEEKPIARSHVNAGVYVLDPTVLQLLGENEYCDMPSLFNRLKERDARTVVYPMHEPWLDIGRIDDLARARTLIQQD